MARRIAVMVFVLLLGPCVCAGAKADAASERLAAQSALAREREAANALRAEAEQAERELYALEQRIAELAVRRDRLLLRLRGSDATGAFPPVQGGRP